MPITWVESAPSDTSSASLADDEIRALKVALATGLSQSVYWPGSGGGSAASAGQMKLGTARTFVDLQSRVSTNSDGSLMQTSDTSRLFGVNSGGSVFLGSARALEHNTFFTANSRWVKSSGTVGNGVNSTYGLPAPGLYDGIPVVTLTAIASAGTFIGPYLSTVTPGGFLADVIQANGTNPAASTYVLQWQSLGTVTF